MACTTDMQTSEAAVQRDQRRVVVGQAQRPVVEVAHTHGDIWACGSAGRERQAWCLRWMKEDDCVLVLVGCVPAACRAERGADAARGRDRGHGLFVWWGRPRLAPWLGS